MMSSKTKKLSFTVSRTLAVGSAVAATVSMSGCFFGTSNPAEPNIFSQERDLALSTDTGLTPDAADVGVSADAASSDAGSADAAAADAATDAGTAGDMASADASTADGD